MGGLFDRINDHIGHRFIAPCGFIISWISD